MHTRSGALVIPFVALVALAVSWTAWRGRPAQAGADEAAARGAYRSPVSLAISPDGGSVYVADRTAGVVELLDAAGKKKRGEIAVRGEPRGLALSADGRALYVAERGAGTVAVIDTKAGRVTGRIPVGRWPVAVAEASKTKRLYVCNEDRHDLSVVDLSQSPPREIKKIAVLREPFCAAVTPDERYVVVTNELPYGVSVDPTLAAEVSIVDADELAVSASVKLPPGSTGVRGACTSPDGKWAYVVHQLGRFNLPVTQLERGWVNTYALSVIDIAKGERLATMLLDDLSQGAADPYAVVCARDGGRLWIAHAGVHEVSCVEIAKIHRLLQGDVPKELESLKDGAQDNIWVRIQKDPSQISELENDLTALYIADAIRRFASGGDGPRALALAPDEKSLIVANYFSGAVAILDPDEGKLLGEISLGPQPEPDAVRRGEMLFHDASYAFQRWNGCASCHHSDGRIDGLRWDFLRDGIGNPKDTPSLIAVDKTPPLNRLATRRDTRECAETGVMVSHMVAPTPEEVDDLTAYLVSLGPEPSPHRTPEGKLTKAAQRGKVLFENKAGCATCHPAPYFTDHKMHDVGFPTPNDPPDGYDTPTLLEVHRTAPYLHDGRALTIRDTLIIHPGQRISHGHAQLLSDQELEDLIQYVLSL